MSQDKTASSSSPILLVEETLARFHNFAMACWNPEVHRDEDNQDVQTALTQLRSWEEDDPSERRNPPHIVAAIRLAICLRENVGLVLDTVPDVASLWKPELDGIEQALNELTGKYQSGAEDYKASLESACRLAYQAKRMCKRLEAKLRRLGGGQDEVEAGAIPTSGLQAGGSEVPADPSEERKCEHSSDFTSVIWLGVKYEFAKGLQAESIKVLWEEWKKGGLSLSEQTIGDKIDSNANNFRLDHVFRRRKLNGQGWCMHKAWGTMIVPAGKGTYKLNGSSTP